MAELLEAAEEDLLAFYRFPASHWPKLRSTNHLERVNKEIARRSDLVGIFPDDASLIRLTTILAIGSHRALALGHRGAPFVDSVGPQPTSSEGRPGGRPSSLHHF